MNAVIIAAGMGTRMKELTRDKPKCIAVQVNGKTLLERQIETLRAAGISKISVIRGYQSGKINLPGLVYYANPNFSSNNILESLFCAEAELNTDVLVCYSDLWYEADVLNALLSSAADISLAVQDRLEQFYAGRSNHPVEHLELVRWDSGFQLQKIGKFAVEDKNFSGEFVGIVKFSKKGCELFKTHYHRAKTKFDGKPFQRAPVFRKSYLTDLFQEMADQGMQIHCQVISGQWFEIDTAHDYDEMRTFFKSRKL